MGVFEVHHAVLVMSALIKFPIIVYSILEYFVSFGALLYLPDLEVVVDFLKCPLVFSHLLFYFSSHCLKLEKIMLDRKAEVLGIF